MQTVAFRLYNAGFTVLAIFSANPVDHMTAAFVGVTKTKKDINKMHLHMCAQRQANYHKAYRKEYRINSRLIRDAVFISDYIMTRLNKLITVL